MLPRSGSEIDPIIPSVGEPAQKVAVPARKKAPPRMMAGLLVHGGKSSLDRLSRKRGPRQARNLPTQRDRAPLRRP
jgi:hypothetical protein